MKILLWNIFLALIWMALTGAFTPASFLVGLALGFGVLWLSASHATPSSYFLKVRHLVAFVVQLTWELVLSSLRVAYDIVTPTYHMKPGVIAVPLDAESDAEILVLANAITLTPGSLSLDVSADRKVLYVHGMFIDDPESFRKAVKRGLERRTLELMR